MWVFNDLASDWPETLRSSESAAKKRSIAFRYPLTFFLDFSTCSVDRYSTFMYTTRIHYENGTANNLLLIFSSKLFSNSDF